MTVTDSPTEKSTSVRTGAEPGVVATLAALRGAAGVRILTTSSIVSADGFCAVAPTNPVTPGVLRTALHDWSVRSIRTRM